MNSAGKVPVAGGMEAGGRLPKSVEGFSNVHILLNSMSLGHRRIVVKLGEMRSLREDSRMAVLRLADDTNVGAP